MLGYDQHGVPARGRQPLLCLRFFVPRTHRGIHADAVDHAMKRVLRSGLVEMVRFTEPEEDNAALLQSFVSFQEHADDTGERVR